MTAIFRLDPTRDALPLPTTLPSSFRLDLTRDALPLPTALPSSLVVGKEGLVEGRWHHGIARSIIPGYARDRDAEVTSYFFHFFQDVISEKRAVPSDRLRTIIRLAEEHISRNIDSDTGSVSRKISQLERYTFAARIQLQDFRSPEEKEALRERIRGHNRKLADRWEALNFSSQPGDSEIFWASPDLVDFIFDLHLHRYIRHPDYNHQIEKRPIQKLRDGGWVLETEAHLKMNDQMTPWSQIRRLIQVEKGTQRLYALQPDGKKQYWMYLDQGFVQHDRHDMEHMKPFKRLSSPPATCKVQVVTSHANPQKWMFADRFLQGARHTFFRIVIGQNFQASHPNLPYRDGEVYSIGWGGPWVDLSFFQPLTAIRGQWYSPDSTEFFAEDLHITDLDVTDEKIVRLFELIRQDVSSSNSFQIVTSNCATHGLRVFREAEILDIPVQEHLLTIMYGCFIPECLRNYLDQVGNFLARHTPEIIQIAVRKIVLFFYSLVISPVFLLLGAWRTKVSYEPETNRIEGMTIEEGMLRARNRIKALFSSLYDLFDPDKMTFDLTFNVWRWQQRDAQEHPERAFFVQQSS